MPWNDSDDPKNKDPWGDRNKQQGPPDLDKVIRDLSRKMKHLFGIKKLAGQGGGSFSGKNSTFGIVALIIVLLVLWVLSGIFIVAPTEESVVLQFGKYQETVGPGPHWIPRFIQSQYKVNTQTPVTFQLQSDFLTKSSDQEDKPKPVIDVSEVKQSPPSTPTAKLSQSDIDKNVVYIELGIQYRINDPKKYLFSIVNGVQTLKQAALSVLSEVVGKMKLDQVLTTGRSELRERVLTSLRQVMDSYQSGIDVFAVNVRKAQAPEEVADAFLEVAQAGQDGQRYQQQAEAYASKVVPLAQGQAARITAEAKAYQEQVVYVAKAAVAKFDALQKVYKEAPDITRERMYLDSLQSVLSHSSKVLIDTKDSNNMLYLPLDKMVQQMSLPRPIVDKSEQVSSEPADAVSSTQTSDDSAYGTGMSLDHYTQGRGY